MSEIAPAGPSSQELHPVNANGEWVDAPPSYDEAIAESVAPVDGPRREFVVPATPDRAPGFRNEEEENSSSRRPVHRRSF